MIMKKIIVLLLLLLVACSSTKELTEKYSRNHELKGIASWYGREFHGKLTASGEKYSVYKLTAAHKTLKFGTIVKVINLENGKSVKVKINDRGPFVKGRIIDLSPRAFKKIADKNQGLAKVEIEILDDTKTFRYKR